MPSPYTVKYLKYTIKPFYIVPVAEPLSITLKVIVCPKKASNFKTKALRGG